MHCTEHPDVPTKLSCSACTKAICEACATHDVDGSPTCASCAHAAEERNDLLGGALVAVMGFAYLAVLALGVVAMRGRPMVGGFAAVAAIVVGRTLQVTLKLPRVVVRRAA